MTVKVKSMPRHVMGMAGVGAAKVGEAEAKGDPSVAPAPGAAEESQQKTVSPVRFALVWFGIPILVVLLSMIIRMQCGVGA